MASEDGSNVVELGAVTRLDLPPDRVLEGAVGQLDAAFVVGWEKDSGELYMASSVADGGELLWLLEKAKKALLEVGE